MPSARFRLRGCVKESVALDDRLGYVDKPAAVPLGVPSKLLEGLVGGNAVAFHEDAFGLFDGRASAERSLEVVKLGEAEESISSALWSCCGSSPGRHIPTVELGTEEDHVLEPELSDLSEFSLRRRCRTREQRLIRPRLPARQASRVDVSARGHASRWNR